MATMKDIGINALKVSASLAALSAGSGFTYISEETYDRAPEKESINHVDTQISQAKDPYEQMSPDVGFDAPAAEKETGTHDLSDFILEKTKGLDLKESADDTLDFSTDRFSQAFDLATYVSEQINPLQADSDANDLSAYTSFAVNPLQADSDANDLSSYVSRQAEVAQTQFKLMPKALEQGMDWASYDRSANSIAGVIQAEHSKFKGPVFTGDFNAMYNNAMAIWEKGGFPQMGEQGYDGVMAKMAQAVYDKQAESPFLDAVKNVWTSGMSNETQTDWELRLNSTEFNTRAVVEPVLRDAVMGVVHTDQIDQRISERLAVSERLGEVFDYMDGRHNGYTADLIADLADMENGRRPDSLKTATYDTKPFPGMLPEARALTQYHAQAVYDGQMTMDQMWQSLETSKGMLDKINDNEAARKVALEKRLSAEDLIVINKMLNEPEKLKKSNEEIGGAVFGDKGQMKRIMLENGLSSTVQSEQFEDSSLAEKLTAYCIQRDAVNNVFSQEGPQVAQASVDKSQPEKTDLKATLSAAQQPSSKGLKSVLAEKETEAPKSVAEKSVDLNKMILAASVDGR